jgi:nitrile hydratase beta subunit
VQLPLSRSESTFHTVWTWADLRMGAEALNPFDYFKFRYYEKWLGGICGYFVAQGYIAAEELEARTKEFLEHPEREFSQGGAASIDERVVDYLMKGDSPRRENLSAPAFGKGDAVRTKDAPTTAHTRLPGYLRGRNGVVETVYAGNYVYLCDTGNDGVGAPMPVYCVRFDPAVIWPGNAESNFYIYADLYAAYLGAASSRNG